MLTGAVIAALVCVVALVGPALATAHQPRATRSIVGGQPASAGTFPWLALVIDDLPNGDAELCTGTVVSPNVVLTAGHCGEDVTTGVVDAASGFVVVTGSLDWTDAAKRHVSGVSQVIVHPGYTPATFDGGDAALLVLSTPTKAPAATLAPASDSALWQPNASVAIAGWGKTDASDSNSIPAQLQWGVSVTQSTGYCAAQALLGGIIFDPSDQLCVVDQPSFQDGTCQGDSGGPLLANYGTATPVEVGVTSFGPDDCDTHDAQFFTLAASISSWAASWVAAVAPAPQPSPPSPSPSPSPSPGPTSTPSPQPTSQPERRTARPAAGVYLGSTSQGRSARLRVAASRTKISSLALAFKLRCTRHRPLSLTVSTRSLNLNGLAFSLTTVHHTNEHVRITGRFDTAGSVKGTLAATWRTRAYGTCRSGPVHWSGWTPTS
jgi:secreted trypsin-like serine protease